MCAARELILFCVKTTDTNSVAKVTSLRFNGPKTVVLSMQNGVDNAERIRAAGLKALPAVVFVAASVPEAGRIKHFERGDLAIGGEASDAPELARIAATFVKAGVPCRISENIAADLWIKFVFNCALNAMSAIARTSYGAIGHDEMGREAMMATAKEIYGGRPSCGSRAATKRTYAQKLVAYSAKKNGRCHFVH